MSAHTPGPWSIEPAWSERCGGDVAIVNRNHMDDDWDVCSVHSTEANARLIAAAPDLLAALTAIVNSLADQDDEGLIEHAEQMIAARAAIAKATGAQS